MLKSPSKTLLLLFILLTTLLTNLNAQEKGRIVGYIPYWQNISYIDSIDFSQMTHVCYAFLTPCSDASMYTDLNRSLLEKIIEKARPDSTKIMIAFGGGEGETFDPDTAMSKLVEDTTAFLKFVSYVMDIVREYDLDGVTNDWEPFKNSSQKADKYEFVMETFNDSLDPLGKLLTSDVIAGSWAAGYMSPRSIELSDYMNIMTYVFNSNIVNSIDSYMQYWLNVKGVPKEKLHITVGFFGTPVNEWSNSYTYQEILAADSNAHNKDSVTINGKIVWYNSPNICRGIIDLAWEKYSGIGIWHLGLDKLNDKSLLKALSDRNDEHINGEVAIQNAINNFPSKSTHLNIKGSKLNCIQPIKKLSVFNMHGKRIMVLGNLKKGSNLQLNKLLNKGVYIITSNGYKNSINSQKIILN